MIVRPFRGRLLVVRQTDHMVVSGRLADAWGNDRFVRPEPFGPLALAAAQHDVGWADWDRAPQLNPDTGLPQSFTEVDQDTRMAIWEPAAKIHARPLPAKRTE